MSRILECQCGAIVVEDDNGLRYGWLTYKPHPVHLTVIRGGRS